MSAPSLRGGSPILSVKNLGVNYGTLVALQDVCWEVYKGQILGIIGPNGAGKTSSFDAVTGMVEHSGHVYVEGVDVTNLPSYLLPSFGLKRTFQQNLFFTELSVLQNMTAVMIQRRQTGLIMNLGLPLRAEKHRSALERFAAEQLVLLGVDKRYHDARPGEIPYGVQRMLSIALAYGEGARVLLLDEPAAGLGGDDMHQLMELLENLRSRGVALIIIEHHMDLIMNMADYICVLNFGRQLALGTPTEIQNNTDVLAAYLGE